jgi:hypothetical protein
MLYLWIFGNNVEDSMGRIRFVIFYFLCGVVAAYSHAAANAASIVPMIGASGAVSGVLGAYLLLYPRARVLTLIIFGFFIRTIEVPALVVLGSWFLLQFLNAFISSGTGQGVAWYAQLRIVADHVMVCSRTEQLFGGRKRDEYLIAPLIVFKLKIDTPRSVLRRQVRCPRGVLPVQEATATDRDSGPIMDPSASPLQQPCLWRQRSCPGHDQHDSHRRRLRSGYRR